jgi:hypothetical protein
MHAEATANQAICPGCEVYARFDLSTNQPSADSVQVRCRACQREWSIDR